jgi:hypothetical protein
MDMAIVDEYTEGMKNGSEFPPLQVFRIEDHYVLVDGYHRLWASQDAKIKEVLCDVHEGTMRDAILFASGVNATHGLRRTKEDKRRAIERLLVDPEWGRWSSNKIAEICKVDAKTVAKYRGNSMEIHRDPDQAPLKVRIFTNKKGTVSKINTSKIGKKAEPASEAQQTPILLPGENLKEHEPEEKPLPPLSPDAPMSERLRRDEELLARARMPGDPIKSQPVQPTMTEFERASRNMPPVNTQPLPRVSKYPRLPREQQDTVTEAWIEDCLTYRYHRIIRDLMKERALRTPLDVICASLDLLSESEVRL